MTSPEFSKSTSRDEGRPSVRIRRGWITGAIYAGFGFIIVLAWLAGGIEDVLRVFVFPGELLLTQFMDYWIIGHGGFIFLFLTNPLVYFVIGFLLGATTDKPSQTWILSLLLGFCMLYLGCYRL
jgi:hypothetical protein